MATQAHRLPSGNWRIQPSKQLRDGTLVRTSITAPTRREAEKQAALWYGLQTDLDAASDRMTVDDALDAYINSCEKAGASPSTIKEYKSRKRTSFPKIINCRLTDLTPAMIQAQIDSRIEEKSIKTVRNDFYLLRPTLAMYAPNINLSRIKIAKKPKRTKLHMQEKWRTQIPLKVAELYGKNDFYIYILFLIFAGIRPSEAFALKWADLSAEPLTRLYMRRKYATGRIAISKAIVRTNENKYQEKPPKTDAGNRTIVLDWSFFEELYAVRPRGKPEERIFQKNPYCNERKWRHVKEALNIPPDLRQYDLRHFHATDVAYSGASEEELMERMGHSTAAFSHSVYVEIFDTHENAVNALLAQKTAEGINILRNAQNA